VIDQLRDTQTESEPELASADLFGHPSDDFIDAFGGCCASIAALLNTLPYLDPLDAGASSDLVCRLCAVASTVGYPAFVEWAPGW
jgi:hypothetical protein